VTRQLPAAADPNAITQALHDAGVPTDIRVLDVTVESDRPTILSRIIRLRLRCDGAAPEAPASVILKTGLPERIGGGWQGGLQEVAFYREVAAAMPPGLVPRCYAAQWDPASEDWHLLLEDLTETHAIATAWPLPPTDEQCGRIIDTLARFHAAWWDDPRLGISIGTRRDGAAIARIHADLANRFARFAGQLGDLLPDDRRALYEWFGAAWIRLLQRYGQGNLTLVHGDAHCWNVFIPRAGGDDLRLFDWDAWRIGIAASDLAYMMALHWYPDRRRRLERKLLDRYHDKLLRHGVRGYDRQALADDYRWATLMQIATPVWQATSDIPPVVWWNHLERIMLAVDDLGCRDLLA
jgi:hypothetical protein